MQCKHYISLWILFSVLACPGAMLTTLRLKTDLLANYDPEMRPVRSHTDITDVTYKLFLADMFFHEDVNALEVRSWVHMLWRDEHLVWDKEEYSGLETLPVRCNRIWMPDVALTSGPTPTATQSAGHCFVKKDGAVSTGMPVTHMAKCVPDITRWPFDTHNCTMRVSSWSYYGNQINLSYGTGSFAKGFKGNRDWDLLNATRVVYVREYPPPRNISWPCISYSFLMQRHSGASASTVFIPGVVLALMTLVTFWMDPTSAERMSLIRINIVCHCMYMIYLGMKLPGNGDKTPLIVTFFRDSFLLAGVSLLVTLCAARMNAAARAPPSWISSITDGVLSCRPGQLLFLGELDPKVVAATNESSGETGDGIALVAKTSAAQGWRHFATLLDRLCFLTFTISLLVLLGGFVPTQL